MAVERLGTQCRVVNDGICTDLFQSVSASRQQSFRKNRTEPKIRTKRYLQNHVVYHSEKMILRNPLADHVR